MRRLACLAALAALSACGSNAVPMARPSDGYAALRAKETLRLGGPLNDNSLELRAGNTLIADRALPNGEPLFCGDVALASFLGGRKPVFTCFARRGDALVAHADRGGGNGTTDMVPPGAIEEFRLN